MKRLLLTSQFKKDLKRYKHNAKVLQTLRIILQYLVEGKDIPKQYKPHWLKGSLNRYMECHLESDTLLLWLDIDNQIIKLVRLGSHSEIF